MSHRFHSFRVPPIPPISPDPPPSMFTKFVPTIRLVQRHSAPVYPRLRTMDSVNIPSENVSNELKVACEQTLKRAKELKKVEPVVAYWCCFAVAQKALKVPNRSKEGTIWLISLLDALEQMKAILATNEAVSNEAAGAAYVENFALKVFMSADNYDRAGNTGKATTRKFVVAGQFIETLRCFENGMTEEMEQKLQYARWKAADGAKALREGRTPASGPPMPEDEINPFPELPPSSPDKASTQLGQSSPPHTTFSAPDRLAFARNTTPSRATPCVSPAFSPGGTPRPAISRIDTSSRESLQTPPQNLSFGSGAWSTVATPGLAENDDEERHFDIGPSAPPLTPPLRPTSANGKNVRFMGPDGAPLSPATTHMTVDSYDAPPGPPPSSFESPRTSPKLPSASIPPPQPRPRDDSSSSNQSRSAINGTASVGTRLNGNAPHRPRVDSATTRPSNSANAAVPPPPPPSLVSYPSHPPPVAQSYGLGLISPSTASGSAAPTRKQIDESQKHAKWAISALDFDDIETARAELRKALATIGG